MDLRKTVFLMSELAILETTRSRLHLPAHFHDTSVSVDIVLRYCSILKRIFWNLMCEFLLGRVSLSFTGER